MGEPGETQTTAAYNPAVVPSAPPNNALREASQQHSSNGSNNKKKKIAIIAGSISFLVLIAIIIAVAASSGSDSDNKDNNNNTNNPGGNNSDDLNLFNGTYYTLPQERVTAWNPGLNAVGGIPHRTKIFRTISPSGGDDTTTIQAALDACPDGQVVQLAAGTFSIRGEGLEISKSNITLRGAGPDKTKLNKATGTNYPVIIIGVRWPKYSASTLLSANAIKGSYSVKLASDPGLKPGDLCVINMLTDSTLTVWSDRSPPGDPSRGWMGEYDRPLGQILEVKSISGTTVTFTTPFHMTFKTSLGAHLVRFAREQGGEASPMVSWSGIEDLYVSNGEGGDGGGNIHLFATSYSWVRNVESDKSEGSSVNLDGAFRCVVRDSYVHSTRNPNPGGGGYGITVNAYSSDNLIENNICWNFNKVVLCRTSGGGNVFGYNYVEDGWGEGYPTIPEVGLNAAHMTTPHYELFEGNQGWNFGTDSVWGNSVYITVFRNHLTGKRRSISPLTLTDVVTRRVCEVGAGHWYYSFLGNVLGTSDQSPAPNHAFIYEGKENDPVPIWMVVDEQKVRQTLIRHGNFDFLTKTQVWLDNNNSTRRDLPPSLYLSGKPSFFGTNPWPWVTPDGNTKTGVLPARQRFDAIHA